jgi:hypothetical protein
VGKIDTHFDGTNFFYWCARMTLCYLEVVDVGFFRVARDVMKLLKNPNKPTSNLMMKRRCISTLELEIVSLSHLALRCSIKFLSLPKLMKYG